MPDRPVRAAGDLGHLSDTNWIGALGDELDTLTDGSDADALHTHASLVAADGSVPFTGTVSGVTPTSSAHLATKGYADSISSGTAAVYPDTIQWVDPSGGSNSNNGQSPGYAKKDIAAAWAQLIANGYSSTGGWAPTGVIFLLPGDHTVSAADLPLWIGPNLTVQGFNARDTKLYVPKDIAQDGAVFEDAAEANGTSLPQPHGLYMAHFEIAAYESAPAYTNYGWDGVRSSYGGFNMLFLDMIVTGMAAWGFNFDHRQHNITMLQVSPKGCGDPNRLDGTDTVVMIPNADGGALRLHRGNGGGGFTWRYGQHDSGSSRAIYISHGPSTGEAGNAYAGGFIRFEHLKGEYGMAGTPTVGQKPIHWMEVDAASKTSQTQKTISIYDVHTGDPDNVDTEPAIYEFNSTSGTGGPATPFHYDIKSFDAGEGWAKLFHSDVTAQTIWAAGLQNANGGWMPDLSIGAKRMGQQAITVDAADLDPTSEWDTLVMAKRLGSLHADIGATDHYLWFTKTAGTDTRYTLQLTDGTINQLGDTNLYVEGSIDTSEPATGKIYVKHNSTPYLRIYNYSGYGTDANGDYFTITGDTLQRTISVAGSQHRALWVLGDWANLALVERNVSSAADGIPVYDENGVLRHIVVDANGTTVKAV